MNDQEKISAALDAVAQRRAERRRFLQLAGGTTIAAGGFALLSACGDDKDPDPSPTPSPSPSPTSTSTTNPDAGILNFLLEMEYLQAQFFARASTGAGLPDALLTGTGTVGAVTGGAAVPFADPVLAAAVREIARDDRGHVEYLRAQLAAVAVAQPAINIAGGADGAFTALARQAGVIGAGDTFDPYASEDNFLLAAFFLEDLMVTAYKGATVAVTSSAVFPGVSGMLAAEAYHAGLIRTMILSGSATLKANANKISAFRDTLDGASAIDQGVTNADGTVNLVSVDSNGLIYSRSTGQTLNILYLNKAAVSAGAFFPAGLNGTVKTSAASA